MKSFLPIPILLLTALAAKADTVQGTVRYENKPYDASGFAGTTEFLPVRYADIEMVRQSDGAILGSGETDDTGAYSVTLSTSDALPDLFVRVYARQENATVRAAVRDHSAVPLLYTASTPPQAKTAGSSPTIDLDITVASGAAGAFNIFDVAVSAWLFAHSIDALSPLPGTLPELAFRWGSGSSLGTYYSPGENTIYLLGKASDPDEFDDDIILHETGHFMAANFSRDDTPGGPHTLVDQLDPRFSWSEGWAHFWSSAVRNHANTLLDLYDPGGTLSRHDPASQVDNFGSGNSWWSLELPVYSDQTVMATNEIAVGAALWDIHDDANEAAFDALSGYGNEIWAVLDDHLPSRTSITLEDFTSGWALQVNPADFLSTTGTSGGVGTFKDRAIRYFEDSNEPNPDSAGATAVGALPAVLALQTFYPAGDEDWFAVTAPTGGVLHASTSDLGDGADTLLRLYDTDGTTLLAENDDRSPSDPSSSLDHLLPVAGNYFVRVNARPGAVTVHGYYNLSISLEGNESPSIDALTASVTTGIAPLRVRFDATVSDNDGTVARREWDFDGDGKIDLDHPATDTVVHTYPRAGTLTAILRITDDDGASVTENIQIIATSSSPSAVTLSSDVNSGTAPLTAVFSASASGFTPALHEWDFESDGIIDAVTVAGNTTHVYRSATSVMATVIVHDETGEAWSASSGVLTINAGADTPVVTALSPSSASGTVPWTTTLTGSVSDGGTIVRLDWDEDGDGRIDARTVPAPWTRTLTLLRPGTFDPSLTALDDSGLTASRHLSESAAPLETVIPARAARIIDPVPGERLSGNAVTITALLLPPGTTKNVRFQYRVDAPAGPWTDIASPLSTSATVCSSTWDVSGLPSTSVYDLRILVDDVVSSGDDDVTVQVHHTNATVTENGASKAVVIDPDLTRWITRPDATLIRFPVDATDASAVFTLTLDAPSLPSINGSASGLSPVGTPVRFTLSAGSASPTGTWTLRLPVPRSIRNPETLQVHWYDSGSGLWKRSFFPVVSIDEGWVEVEAHAFEIHSLFRRKGRSGGGGGCSHTGGNGTPVGILLALAILLGWKCSGSPSRRRP